MRGLRKLIALLLIAGGVYWLFSGGGSEIMRYFYPLSYADEVEAAAKEYGLDEYFVRSVIKAESGYEERASSGRAHGLMQLTDETAAWIADKTELSYAKRLEPETNIKMGCYYLAYLLKKFGGSKEALAAYNAGPGNVEKWLQNEEYSKNGKNLLEIPYPETAKYVQRVEKFYTVYKRLYE